MRRRTGFSLVELLITVAIVGILSAIAVPAYQGFWKNAKRSQARAAMGDIFEHENLFRSEFSMYSTRFDALGYQPTGAVYLDVGFTVDYGTAPPAPFGGTSTCIQLCPIACPASFNAQWICMPTANSFLDGTLVGTASQNAFLVEAHTHWGSLSNPGETWSMDNKGKVTFVVPAN